MDKSKQVGFFIAKKEAVMKNIMILLIVSLLCIVPKISNSCTTFCLDKGGHLVFGKNFGWIQNDGLVFVNKRGVLKIARSEITLDDEQKLTKSEKVLYKRLFNILKVWRNFFLTDNENF